MPDPREAGGCPDSAPLPAGSHPGLVARRLREPGMPRELSRWGGGSSALALRTGKKEEGVVREVPVSFPKLFPLLLGSGCARRGCGRADTALLAGKWSAFAERADSVTGHSGAAGPPGRLSGHVGGMGDARSHRCWLSPLPLAPGLFRGICVIGTKCWAFFFLSPFFLLLLLLLFFFFPPVFWFLFFVFVLLWFFFLF